MTDDDELFREWEDCCDHVQRRDRLYEAAKSTWPEDHPLVTYSLAERERAQKRLDEILGRINSKDRRRPARPNN